jgi:hypothetical protein
MSLSRRGFFARGVMEGLSVVVLRQLRNLSASGVSRPCLLSPISHPERLVWVRFVGSNQARNRLLLVLQLVLQLVRPGLRLASLRLLALYAT